MHLKSAQKHTDSQLLRLNIRCWVLVLDHFFSVCLLRERECSSKSVYVCVCVS